VRIVGGFCACVLVAAGLLLAACGGPSGSSPSGGATAQPSHSPLPSILSGVACASSTDCWAVGTYKTGTSTRTLIEQNTGSGWKIVSSPRVGSADGLGAVTCLGAQGCWAVGDYGSETGSVEPLIEHNSGNGWTVVRSPTPEGGGQKALSSVSCADANDCWAVGNTGIEQYAGGTWRIVSSDTPEVRATAGL